MSKEQLFVQEPSSPEALQRLWLAYDFLPDPEKIKIVRFLQEREKEIFHYLISKAGFPGGTLPARVIKREHGFGKIVDRFLKEHRKGRFGRDVLSLVFRNRPESPFIEIFDALVGASSPAEVEERLRRFTEEHASDPLPMLAVRFFEVYLNPAFDWTDQEASDGGPLPGPTTENQSEMGKLRPFDDLDKALQEIITLTDRARMAAPWSNEDWNAAISDARNAVVRVREEVSQLSSANGGPLPEWKSREELESILKQLEQDRENGRRQDQLVQFLTGLVEEIRALKPRHRLLERRLAQETVRDESVGEMIASCKAEAIHWPDSGPRSPREWLEWAIGLDGDALQGLIERLQEGDFPKTASLVADLDLNYDMGIALAAAEVTPNSDCVPETEKPVSGFSSEEKSTDQEVPGSSGDADLEEPPQEEAIAPTEEPLRVIEPTLTHEVAEQALPEQPKAKTNEVITDAPAKPHAKPMAQSTKSAQPEPNIEPKESIETTAPSFAALGELPEAAQAALSATESELEPAIEKVIWLLLDRDERTLAFQILRDAHDTGLTSAFPIPPGILETLALLPAYSSNSSEVPHHIRTILQTEDLSEIFKTGESETNELRRFLVAAALLRPALFDPSSNAGSILDGVRLGNLSGLHAIQTALLEFGRKGVALNATILSATLNAQGWKEREEELVEQVRQFREAAPARKINYAHATWIWSHWFRGKDGWMRRLFGLAETKDRQSLERLAESLAEADVDAEIDRGWKESRGRGDLVGTALGTLHRLAGEAIDLLRQRLDHWQSGALSSGDYRHNVLAQLAEIINKNLGPAEEELKELVDDGTMGGERRRIAAILMRRELRQLKDALSGKLTSVECPSRHQWLSIDLLRLSSLDLDDDMEVIVEPDGPGRDERSVFWLEEDPVRQRLARKLTGLQSPIRKWEQAFEDAISRGDHRSARRILDQMTRDPGRDCTPFETRKSAHAEDTRNRLRRDLSALESRLVSAYSKGWLTPEVHAENAARVQSMIEDLSQRSDGWKDLPFHEWNQRSSQVSSVIDTALDREVQKAMNTLRSIENVKPAGKLRVQTILDNGDVHLANEYIRKLEAGEPIDDIDYGAKTEHFTSFYGNGGQPGIFGSLMERFESKAPPFNPNKAVSEIQEEPTWCGIDLSPLDAADRSRCAAVLQQWFSVQRSQRIDEKGLKQILVGLDFPAGSVERDGEGYLLRLTEDLVCPIPDFGSEIRSRKVRVLVDAKRNSVDDLLQWLEKLRFGSSPTILLWMRPVPLPVRRKFSRLCREKSLKVLLIDTVLTAYVLTTESPRLRALFECGLPFTNVTPYTTTGGTLAEEMFFGRRREIEAIESAGPSGTCFVYGGRQIGKTVLLRKVERDFPKRGNKHVSLYLDLNFHAVGQTVSMDEIWRIVAEELSKKEPSIFVKSPRAQFTVDGFSKQVTHWLKEDEERRILLLLDEADRFLQADGDAHSEPGGMPFGICQKLKGLMDETKRRFKVVFAGLHNVQRSTRVANNPLAQLGIPVCVGPLFQNGESREAARLVQVPMAVSGVFFDSPDTINTILARTNYYPNLIQIFCSHLLKLTIGRQSQASPDKTPPFTVTSEGVESVFSNHDIRDEIRKKFMLTLDLDRRFSLIANYMAWTAKDFPDGFSVDDIQRDAVPWWPRGFEADRPRTMDALHEDLAVLLNEMCGLGILRRDSKDRFFLRSPNVVALLGTPGQIEKVLESAVTWEAPPTYSPDSFRRPSNLHGDQFHWRSCLTARQETVIKDPKIPVVVISGCKTSGIDEVIPCIEQALGSDYLIQLPETTSKEAFKQSFSTLSEREKAAGKTVVVVPAAAGWDADWILEAKNHVTRFTAKDRPVGVVFVADPDLLWNRLDQWKSITTDVGSGALRLQRWDNPALRQWIADANQLSDCLPALCNVTGGWHEAVRILGEFAQKHGSFGVLGGPEDHASETLRAHLSLDGSFGFFDGIDTSAMKILAELGEAVPDPDLRSLHSSENPGQGVEAFDRTLEWAELLGIVDRRDQTWLLDPVVADLVRFQAQPS